MQLARFKSMHLIICSVGVLFSLWTGNQVWADSTGITPPDVIATTSPTNLAYVTFKTTEQGSAMLGQCPLGLTLVPGSPTDVPPIGNPPMPGFEKTYKYWQCIQTINGIVKMPNITPGNLQPYAEMEYPHYDPSLFTSLQKPGEDEPTWLEGPDNTVFTYFVFPGNQFIPTGIGGSGVLCPAAGGTTTVSCKNGLGKQIINFTRVGVNNPVIFYLGPSDTAHCTVSRTYARGGSCAAQEVLIPSGQAKVMSCCWGEWSCSTGAWDNPNLTKCGACPCNVPGNLEGNHEHCAPCS